MRWREHLPAPPGVALALALVALGGCATPVGHEVRYTGAMPGCAAAAATLTRQGDKFAFAPTDGVVTIRGAVAPDGGFSGTLNTQPPDKPPFVLSVRGTIGDETATVDFASPRCRAHATFARAHPPVL